MAGFDSALAPFTLKGFYLCTWGTAVGTNVWQTLVCLSSTYLIWCRHQSRFKTDIQSGVRTFQSLPRQTFGTLQARLTPFYFSTSTILTSTLLLTHLYFHPSLISAPTVKPHWHSSEEGRQGLLIVAGLIPQLLNLIWFGPQATKVMFERHRLEKLEGKEYNEANVSSSPFRDQAS